MSNNSQKVPARIVDLSEQSSWPFVRKLLLVVGIAASALALWRLSDVLLLAFGSILLALVLRGLAGIISGRTRISEGLAVAVVVIAMTSAFAAFGWLFGSQIATQFELLSEDLPQGFSQIVRDVRTTPWGAWIFLRAQEVNLTSATTHGPLSAFYAALLYAGVHFVEGNLITPIIQAEVVELPPILALFATLVFGLLLGPIGLLLAAPLTVVILVIVNTFYLEDTLGEERSWPAT
jgi:predicted PurR-regulated permease PerM